MKKTTLRRYTPLKTHKPLKRVSKEQAQELKRRANLKRELIMEHGEHCMTCHDVNRDWRGISLSHIIPLSRGGKTEHDNCILECFPCHEIRHGWKRKWLPVINAHFMRARFIANFRLVRRRNPVNLQENIINIFLVSPAHDLEMIERQSKNE